MSGMIFLPSLALPRWAPKTPRSETLANFFRSPARFEARTFFVQLLMLGIQGSLGYTLWQFGIAIEHGPFIVDLPIENGDFP